jgi:hypothetical protein
MKKRHVLALVLAFLGRCHAAEAPHSIGPQQLNDNTRALLNQSLELEDKYWNDKIGLIQYPSAQPAPSHDEAFMVRESSWYALGLLLRDAPGDRERAARALDAVLREQYNTPNVRWYGTFRRSPEEPSPHYTSKAWKSYDPNWREFIGSTFAVILMEYPDRIPQRLGERMNAAIDCAVEGEMKDGRLKTSYSNIALMYGFLLDFAAQREHRADWQKRADKWTTRVYRLFKQNDAFSEYNSPTYYGVDLYGLALWRSYGSTAKMRAMGSEMEIKLWREIAASYQPSLHNISGPFDRSYGMDMESYVSLVGMWMRMELNGSEAPLPSITPYTDHVADIWFAPHMAILGARIPPDVLPQLKSFAGEHLLYKKIASHREATSWIGRDVIFGGEATGKRRDTGATTQFHPATIQWRTPSGKIGWVRLIQSPELNAVADERGLTISTTGTVRLLVQAYDTSARLEARQWNLPGLKVDVTSDAKDFTFERNGDAIELVYSGMTALRLNISAKQARGAN